MITTVQNLHIGNALRLFIKPPAGYPAWRILRKDTDSFTGPDDAGAIVVYEGDEKVIVDKESVQNGVMQFYRPYYTQDGQNWTAGPTASGTSTSDYQDYTVDVYELIRDRLERGLKVECDRGTFQTELGYIPVLTAPPTMERDHRLPLVSIHYDSEESSERAIGENISGDEFDSVGFDWEESEGWWANISITIAGWSLNPSERVDLRKAIRRIMVANMELLAAEGVVQANLSLSDIDLVNGEIQNGQLYQVMGTFTCVAPVRVGGKNNVVISNIISQRISNG